MLTNRGWLRWAVLDQDGKQITSYVFRIIAAAHARLIGGSVEDLLPEVNKK